MKLLQTLTLGTGRHPIKAEVNDYLALRDAVDPTADDAEKALATWAITERLERLRLTTTRIPPAATVITEQHPTASGKLARALQLVFEDTYTAILPEAIQVLYDRQLLFPPNLLPGLLGFATNHANSRPLLAEKALAAGGNRARWLAGQHPEWKALGEGYDFAGHFAREISPAGKRDVLSRWRATEPEAALAALRSVWAEQSPKNQETLVEGLAVGIGPRDLPWLREALLPKRKRVRRAVLQLLLLAEEETATSELINLTAASLKDDGTFLNVASAPEAKETLLRYGGLQAKETIGEFLLLHQSPTTVPDLLGLPLTEFWHQLSRAELKAAARAVLTYGHPPAGEAFLAYALMARRDKLPVPELTGITAALPQESFTTVFHRYLETEKDGFHSGTIASQLAVSRNEPWSERISKAYVHALVARIRDSRGLPYSATREQGELWKLATPLLHVDTFAFLRQHLHSMTERPDQIGRLSLEMLQTTAFRRALHE